MIEFDIAVDGNDVPDSVKDNPICRIRRFPWLGYGKLLKVDFHDSACDSHFGANEEVDGPVRRDRYLD